MEPGVLAARILLGGVTFSSLWVLYKVTRLIPARFGSNGRAIAYLLDLFAYPAIILLSLTSAGVNLAVTGGIGVIAGLGGQEFIKSSIAIFLNLRDDVYQIGDIVSLPDETGFYEIIAVKNSGIKLLNISSNYGCTKVLPPSNFSTSGFINYTQDGAATLCKQVFPVSLKAKMAQPGKSDINKIESAIQKAAQHTQDWIIQTTQHSEAQSAFSAQCHKQYGRQDIPATIAMVGVEKFIHYYQVGLWIPGVEIYRVKPVLNYLLNAVWVYAAQVNDIEMAQPDTKDDSDMVEAIQAIADSIKSPRGF